MVQRLGNIGVMVRCDVLGRDDRHVGRRAHVLRRDALGRDDRLAKVFRDLVRSGSRRRSRKRERSRRQRGQDGSCELLFLHDESLPFQTS